MRFPPWRWACVLCVLLFSPGVLTWVMYVSRVVLGTVAPAAPSAWSMCTRPNLHFCVRASVFALPREASRTPRRCLWVGVGKGGACPTRVVCRGKLGRPFAGVGRSCSLLPRFPPLRGASERLRHPALPLLGFPRPIVGRPEEKGTHGGSSARFLCEPGTRGAGGVVLAFWVVSRHPTAPNCAIGHPCEHPGCARPRLC